MPVIGLSWFVDCNGGYRLPGPLDQTKKIVEGVIKYGGPLISKL